MRLDGRYFQDFNNKVQMDEICPKIKRTFKLNEIVETHNLTESEIDGGKIVVVL